MANFTLRKNRGIFYLTLFKEGLTTPSGAVKIKPFQEHQISAATPQWRRDRDKIVVVGNYIVNKTDLYDFLCDEGKEVVSRPRGDRGNK